MELQREDDKALRLKVLRFSLEGMMYAAGFHGPFISRPLSSKRFPTLHAAVSTDLFTVQMNHGMYLPGSFATNS